MKKILSLILALAAVFSLAACGPKGQLGGETSDVLKIDLLDAGYGTEFCYKLKEIFEEEHPGKTVEIKSSNTIQLSTENKIPADRRETMWICSSPLTATGAHSWTRARKRWKATTYA